MSKKDALIRELQENIDALACDYEDLSREYTQKCYELFNVQSPAPAPAKKNRYFGSVAFDFWPLTDWVRFSHSSWKPGSYFQVCLGPLRVDFAED